VIAAALAIGPLAGLASWQIGLHGHRGSTVTPAPLQIQLQGGSQTTSLPANGQGAAEQPGDGSAIAGSTAPATSSVPTVASTPSIYLVGTAAQASEVQQRLDWAAIGWQPLDATVLVVAPEASLDEVTGLLNTMNESRRLQGLAPVTAVDLRSEPPQARGGRAW
jgi:hypothetical protein